MSNSVEVQSNNIETNNNDNKYNPHSVTMSALAASTAIVRGVFSSMSAAFWFAPLFKNKHTCLKQREKLFFLLFLEHKT